jgi:hypothetical protein
MLPTNVGSISDPSQTGNTRKVIIGCIMTVVAFIVYHITLFGISKLDVYLKDRNKS